MSWQNVNKYFARFGDSNEWTLTKSKVKDEYKYQLFHHAKLQATNSNPRVLMDLHKELTK